MKTRKLFVILTAVFGILFFGSEVKAQWEGSCINTKCASDLTGWSGTLTRNFSSFLCDCALIVDFQEYFQICNGQRTYQIVIETINFMPTDCDCWPSEQALFEEVIKELLYRMAGNILELSGNGGADVIVYMPACWMKDEEMLGGTPVYRRRPCYQNDEECCKVTYTISFNGAHAESAYKEHESPESIDCIEPCFTVCPLTTAVGDLGKVVTTSGRVSDQGSNDTETVNGATDTYTKPNPANESVEVVYSSEAEGPIEFMLFDALGNTIMKENYNKTKGDINILVDFKNKSTGVYYYKINEAGTFTGGTIILSK